MHRDGRPLQDLTGIGTIVRDKSNSQLLTDKKNTTSGYISVLKGWSLEKGSKGCARRHHR